MFLDDNWVEPTYVGSLPKNDELRELLCGLNPNFAYWYARYVDCGPNDETRKSCCVDPFYSYRYAIDVDKCARPDTREVAYRDLDYEKLYIKNLGG
jgi:hypothetical protein